MFVYIVYQSPYIYEVFDTERGAVLYIAENKQKLNNPTIIKKKVHEDY